MKKLDVDKFLLLVNEENSFVLILSASWCGPCKVVHPVFEKLSEENKDNDILFCEIDVDDWEPKEIGEIFKARSVPTVIFYKKGIEVGRVVGLQSKEFYIKKVKELL